MLAHRLFFGAIMVAVFVAVVVLDERFAPWYPGWLVLAVVAMCKTALEVVGLGDRMRHYPRQLSGGQEQRVGIARAIVADPTFLLCDEPTGDLDRKSADEVLDLLDRLVREHGKTALMVTHDPLAAERARTVLHLEKGVLVEAAAAGRGR